MAAAYAASPHFSPAAAETTLLHDVEVVWDAQLVRGTPAHIDVRLRGASSLTESQPIAGHVTLGLVSTDKENPRTWALYSGAVGLTPDGRADERSIGFKTPLVPAGNYLLTLITASAYGDKTLERSVRVVDPSKLLFRTDRGVYKPGQTIQWRAVALNSADHHPLADAAVAVTITDPRGTQVWRDTLKTGSAPG